MIRVYIIGPYSGQNESDVQNNIAVAYRYAGEVVKRGWAALCPHSLYFMDMENVDEDMIMKCCLEWLSACDYALVLPKWEQSQGSKIEIEFAQSIKLPLAWSLEQLDQMIQEELEALANESE